MRAKHYFWNRKHHKELDRKMGLSRQMAEPFKSLASACGMDTELEGTHGMMPFFLFTNKQLDIFKTVDVASPDAKKSFPFIGLN